jgi:hypothetical protein
VTVFSRLRKDSALWGVPSPRPEHRRGPNRIDGERRIDLAKRAGQRRGWAIGAYPLYGKPAVKRYKTFVVTWRPDGGVIRVVLVDEPTGWVAFFCTNPAATVADVLGNAADCFSLETTFRDCKEVVGAGQQKVRFVWANVGAFHVCPWTFTMTEAWAWGRACPLGRGPGRGWVLLARTDLDTLDLTADQDLTFFDDVPGRVPTTFKKITLVAAQCVVPARDRRRAYLCAVVDRRERLGRIPLNAAYNLRSALTGEDLDGSLDSGTPWTWEGVVQDLWTALRTGPGADLPASAPDLPFTPDGTPENLADWGGWAWEALCDVLDRIGCAVRYWPAEDAFTFVRLGTADAASDAEVARLEARGEKTWDSDPVDPVRGWRPEKVRVRFARSPLPADGSTPWYVADVGLPAATGVAGGTFVQLDDDLAALGATGTPSNSAALAARAAERAEDWLRKRQDADRPALVEYRDVQPGAATILGSVRGEIAVDDRVAPRTSVRSYPDGSRERWGPLARIPRWWPPGSGSGCCGWCADEVTLSDPQFSLFGTDWFRFWNWGTVLSGHWSDFESGSAPTTGSQTITPARQAEHNRCTVDIPANTGEVLIRAGLQLLCRFAPPVGPTSTAITFYARLIAVDEAGDPTTATEATGAAFDGLTDWLPIMSGQWTDWMGTPDGCFHGLMFGDIWTDSAPPGIGGWQGQRGGIERRLSVGDTPVRLAWQIRAVWVRDAAVTTTADVDWIVENWGYGGGYLTWERLHVDATCGSGSVSGSGSARVVFWSAPVALWAVPACSSSNLATFLQAIPVRNNAVCVLTQR